MDKFLPAESGKPLETLVDIWKAALARHADRPAAVYEGRTWTYGELAPEVDALAASLAQEFAVRKGDRVAAEPAHLLNLSGHYITRLGLRLGAAVHGSTERTFHILHATDLFSPPKPVDASARIYLSGFLAYRSQLSAGWIEFGLRAYDFLNIPYVDRPTVVSEHGEGMGGEVVSRRLFFFVRGAL